jgi:hypothetical protein
MKTLIKLNFSHWPHTEPQYTVNDRGWANTCVIRCLSILQWKLNLKRQPNLGMSIMICEFKNLKDRWDSSFHNRHHVGLHSIIMKFAGAKVKRSKNYNYSTVAALGSTSYCP